MAKPRIYYSSKVKDVSSKFSSYREGVFLSYPKIWDSHDTGWVRLGNLTTLHYPQVKDESLNPKL
jgi:hypothetical protein